MSLTDTDICYIKDASLGDLVEELHYTTDKDYAAALALEIRKRRGIAERPATPTQETPLEKCAQCGKLTEETWSCSDGVNESIRVCADCRGER